MPDARLHRGSIWTVPTAGPDGLAFVLSGPIGASRGRAEFIVIPLYEAKGRVHTSLDFQISATETSVGVDLFAALWNSRPILATALGEKRAEALSGEVTLALRDAYLSVADPSVTIPVGRLGTAIASRDVRTWRAEQQRLWQPLTGDALSTPERSSFGRVATDEPRIVVYKASFGLNCALPDEQIVFSCIDDVSEPMTWIDTREVPEIYRFGGRWAYSSYVSIWQEQWNSARIAETPRERFLLEAYGGIPQGEALVPVVAAGIPDRNAAVLSVDVAGLLLPYRVVIQTAHGGDASANAA